MRMHTYQPRHLLGAPSLDLGNLFAHLERRNAATRLALQHVEVVVPIVDVVYPGEKRRLQLREAAATSPGAHRRRRSEALDESEKGRRLVICKEASHGLGSIK